MKLKEALELAQRKRSKDGRCRTGDARGKPVPVEFKKPRVRKPRGSISETTRAKISAGVRKAIEEGRCFPNYKDPNFPRSQKNGHTDQVVAGV